MRNDEHQDLPSPRMPGSNVLGTLGELREEEGYERTNW